MVNSNVNALGVIFANTYDNLVPELVAERSMASIPFGGRYRLIDFTLSSMPTPASTMCLSSCVKTTTP